MLSVPFSLAILLLLGITKVDGIRVRNENGEWVRKSLIERRAGPGDVLRIPLANVDNKSYSTLVLMGTPIQEVQLAISLSQNHVLLASDDERGGMSYHHARSSSYQAGSGTMAITNAGGESFQASFSRELVTVGEFGQVNGAEFVYNAAIGIMDPSAKERLFPFATYGILGFGFSTSSGAPANSTFMINWFPRDRRSTTFLCGLELNRAEPGLLGGMLTLGAVDTTAFSGQFGVLDVTPAQLLPGLPSWAVPLDEMLLRITNPATPNAYGEVPIFQGGYASIDPYYPFISIPTNSADFLYGLIPGASKAPSDVPHSGLDVGNTRYIVPCNATLTFVLTFGGTKYVMNARDGIMQEGNRCFGSIEAHDAAYYRIGSPFLRNVYTGFGIRFNEGGGGTPVVMFANKVQRTSDGTQSSTATATTTRTNSSSPTIVLKPLFMLVVTFLIFLML
ncbi:acid protease [Serendipita vermifera]|nr:acid protease [Serendipita vermifera]